MSFIDGDKGDNFLEVMDKLYKPRTIENAVNKDIIEAGIAYTISTRPNVICGDAFADDDIIRQMNRNPAFEAGAKHANNTTVDRVCKWLNQNIDNYNVYDEIEWSNLLNDLKQAMKVE